MVRIAIVEDDEECRNCTLSYIKRFIKESGKQIEADFFSDGVDFLEQYRSIYCAVFMDIEMPYMNGIEVSKKLREKDDIVALIFMTNMAQYAIKGYEVNAIDYIVKPVSYFTFAAKLEKALKYHEKYTDYDFTVSFKNGKTRLQTSKIYYIEVMNHQLLFHTVEGIVEVSGSLSKMESMLGSYHFSRCNHCYLVNLRFVLGVTENTVFVGDDALQISRSRKKEFMADLMGYRGGLR